jgi:hypothetical protein
VPEVGVCILISKDKWQKLKIMVSQLLTQLKKDVNLLSHKELLSDRGFLVYVMQAYPAMAPYLKGFQGFHLTVEMWRGNRDVEGWKLMPKALTARGATEDSWLGTAAAAAAELAYLMRKKTDCILRGPSTGKTLVAPWVSGIEGLVIFSSSPIANSMAGAGGSSAVCLWRCVWKRICLYHTRLLCRFPERTPSSWGTEIPDRSMGPQ